MGSLTMNSEDQQKFLKKKPLHKLFEQQVKRTPNSQAISFPNRSATTNTNGLETLSPWTYDFLNGKANQLAYLILNHANKDNATTCGQPLIALLLEEREDYLLASLAVLKSGRAFIPLSLEHPINHLKRIYEDAGKPLIITKQSIISKFKFPGLNFICMEEAFSNKCAISNPNISCKASDLAYVMYTSGSTGLSKGVMIEHKSIINLANWQISKYGLTPSDKSALFNNPAFDVSIIETWPFLLIGATVQVVPKEYRYDSKQLVNWTIANCVTILDLPQAVGLYFVESFMESRTNYSKSALRFLTVGGERVSSSYPKELPFIVVNAYGPTEATVQVTTYFMNESNRSKTSFPPIGKPIDNVQVYIWNGETEHPLDVNEVGEIWIGGEGLARGYLHNKNLTNAKFIKNPFKHSGRVYPTGDLGKWLPCGNIEYIGRIDDQIKLRGFRIQPQEIEFILKKMPEIYDAAVVVKETEFEKQLVAFVILNEGNTIKQNETEMIKRIKNFCINNCPPYMVPVHWSLLSQFPLTPNGKTDKKALTLLADKIDFSTNDLENINDVPLTETEKTIADIWSQVLRIPLNNIRKSSNFFELGGHSLLIMQVINRVREKFRIRNITPADLFLNSNFQKFVQHVLNLTNDTDLSAIAKTIKTHDGLYPLSPAQQLIWMHMEKKRNGSMYNEIDWITIPDQPNAPALERALNKIIERHEALRTTITIKSGKPFQQFENFNKQTLTVINCQDQKDDSSKQFIHSECNKTMDLAKGPLVKFYLLKFENKSSQLVIICHHLIMDGVSLTKVLIPELVLFYQHEVQQTTKVPKELLYHYSDYVSSYKQANNYKTPQYLKALDFWKNTLENATPLNIPNNTKKRNHNESSFGNSHSFVMNSQLYDAITNISQSTGTTPYLVLVSALNVLLHRYTGQRDISICGITSGRDEIEAENLVGHFTNLVVFRNQMAGNLNFSQVLQAVTENAIKVYENQSIPFLQVLSHLKIDDDQINQTLSSVVMSMELEEAENPLGWSANQLADQNSSNSKFDLSIRIEKKLNHFVGLIQYNANLYEESTISNFATHFLKILKDACKYSSAKEISKLTIMPQDQLDVLLNQWNNTTSKYPSNSNQTIHQIFEEQAAKFPNQIAVEDSNSNTVTYQELNQMSTELAITLQQEYRIGTTEEDEFVVIILPQGINFVVSVLAVLKAGAAFIPLNEDYPSERIKFVIRDSKCAVLLSDSNTLQRWGINPNSNKCIEDGACTKILNLNISRSVKPDQELIQQSNTSALAYVIYTSGSTGQPKGVLINHKSAMNFCNGFIKKNSLSKDDKSSLIASPSFDICILEMFPYLFVGATLAIAPSDVKKEPKLLQKWMADKQITMSFMTPALAEPFLKLDFSKEKSTLKKLYTGGDTLTFYPRHELPFDVVNSYGPTETTVGATEVNLRTVDQICSTPPIGRPMSNYKIYILDPHMNLVPIGVTGEIYISGIGVARGYLNRPELTKERFLTNPFTKEPDFSRMYKTGDLACWLLDGNIHFEGRLDEQVKIRGFRVELGEIQSILDSHHSVQQAVVLAKQINNSKELIAYIQPADDNEVSTCDNILNEQFNISQKLFEQVYNPLLESVEENSNIGNTASILGWHDSFTGKEIPEGQMQEWVTDTVTQIMQFKPKRVLEIGCGSGLLLDKIAPFVESYTATDFSSSAIESIRKRLQSTSSKSIASKINLITRPGDIFTVDDEQAYDMVIINSVIQYFPDLSYLIRVLEGTTKSTISGGHIFVGDVRSLELLEAFHGAVTKKITNPDTTYAKWKNLISNAMDSEEELVISPLFFETFANNQERLSHATINLRRGFAKNEMNCFRYNAVLHVNVDNNNNNIPVQHVDWVKFTSLTNAKAMVKEMFNSNVKCTGVCDIPNARVFGYVKSLQLNAENSEQFLMKDLEKELEFIQTEIVDPETVAQFGESRGYSVRLSFSQNDSANFNIVFCKGIDCFIAKFDNPLKKKVNFEQIPHSNQPLEMKKRQKQLADLKTYLKSKLPSYMIPSAWVFVDSIPTTINGKVDKKELLKMQVCSRLQEGNLISAETDLEKVMVNIWSEMLNRSSNVLSITDNFFEIGGNSLLAIQLIESINREFEIEIPLRSLFHYPELQQLCKHIQEIKQNGKNDVFKLDDSIVLMNSPTKDIKRTPVVFIHPVGGTVFCYKSLSNLIGKERDFYAIEDPSIHRGQIMFQTVQEMATAYIKLIRSQFPSGKIIIGGHSFGGLVAFEIAHQLGPEDIECVVLLDSTIEQPKMEKQSKKLTSEAIIRCHNEIQLEKYQKSNLNSLDDWLKLGSHRYEMALNYNPPTVNSKVALFKAKDEDNSDSFCWQSCATQKIEEIFANGDHDSMLAEPNITSLANSLMNIFTSCV